MSMIRVLIAVLAIAAVANAYSTGAGMCDVEPTNPEFRAQMGAEDASQYNAPGARTISLSVNTTWTNNGTIVVSINTATSFKGLLIYAVDASGTKVGTFITNSHFRQMGIGAGSPSCSPSGTTFTHIDATSKPSGTTITYIAPMYGTTAITFRGIIAESVSSQWWVLSDVTLASASTNVNAPSSSSSSSSSTGLNGATASGSSFNSAIMMMIGSVAALLVGLITRW